MERGYGKDEFEGRIFDCESRRLFQIVRHNNFSNPSPTAIRPFVKWYNVDRLSDLVDGEGIKAGKKLYTILGADPSIFEGGDQASFLSNVWVPKGAEPFGVGDWTRIQPQLFDNGAELVRYQISEKTVRWDIPFRFKLSITKSDGSIVPMVNRNFTSDDAINLVPQQEYQLAVLRLYVNYYKITDVQISPST